MYAIAQPFSTIQQFQSSFPMTGMTVFSYRSRSRGEYANRDAASGDSRYLQQFDIPDRQEPSALKTKTSRHKGKIVKLREEMRHLAGLRVQMLAAPGQQISLTDPDARSMATSGRGSGVVGYNVQVDVETKHHPIITHEVTNVGTDPSQLATVAEEAKATLKVENLEAVADRGYFNGEEILTCEEAGIMVTLPKPMTSNCKAEGASASRTSGTFLKRMLTYLLPAKGLPTTTRI